ncbi:hypothetical protein DPMN_008739 [Dreissena polymorpha]|uniref:Uncharacterized protein n=1 Tax=Dreissena polymorpha TaxID=45954 RepID=A0A9D4MYQ1_DREPO|nr:hypothetical protein DPMN_008739 [Dreissena polymorpha]
MLLLKINSPTSGGRFFNRQEQFADWTINVTIRVLARKNAAPWRPCFQPTKTIFEIVQDIIRTNLQAEFYEIWTINMTLRVKNAPPRSGNVFKTIFELFQDIIGAYFPFMGKCHASSWSYFQQTISIFELVQHFIGTYVLTNFNEDRTIHLASRVYQRKNGQPYDIHLNEDQTINGVSRVLKRKNAPPPRTYILTKFPDDRTINVASRVLTRKKAPFNKANVDAARRTKGNHKSSP